MQKNESEHNLAQYIKRFSKWIKDLNVTAITVKLIEENKGKNLHDI
jgi:hypothetical protein